MTKHCSGDGQARRRWSRVCRTVMRVILAVALRPEHRLYDYDPQGQSPLTMANEKRTEEAAPKARAAPRDATSAGLPSHLVVRSRRLVPKRRMYRPARPVAALGTSPCDIAGPARADLLLPVLDHPAVALGCCWAAKSHDPVGRRMAQIHRRILGAEPSIGVFFPCDATQTRRWQACCDAVDDCGVEPGRRDAMRVAARAAFGACATSPASEQ